MKLKFSNQQAEFLKENIAEVETKEAKDFIDALKANAEIEIEYDVAIEIADICADIEAEYVMNDESAETPASIVTMISTHPEY